MDAAATAKAKREAGLAELAKFRSKKPSGKEEKTKQKKNGVSNGHHNSTPPTTEPPVENSTLKQAVLPQESTPSKIAIAPTTAPTSPPTSILISDTTPKIRALEQINKVYAHDNKALTQAVQQLKEQLEASNTERDQLRIKAQEQELELTQLKQKQAVDLLPLRSLEQQVLSLQMQLDQSNQRHLQENSQHISQLEALNENLRIAIDQKAALQKELSQLEAEKSELVIKTSNLQMTVSTLTASHAEGQQDLLKAKSKINTLEANMAPKEKELAQKETEYQQLQAQNKKLEATNEAHIQTQNKLKETIKTTEETLQAKIQTLQADYASMTQSHQYQAKAIDSLMAQRKAVTQQLTNEIKRNGLLTKENSELKYSLQIQQLIVQNLDIDQKTIEVISSKASQTMKLPPPNFGPLTTHRPPEPFVEDTNRALVAHVPGEDRDFTHTQQSWLASLPLIGRLWGSSKVLKKTFEVHI